MKPREDHIIAIGWSFGRRYSPNALYAEVKKIQIFFLLIKDTSINRRLAIDGSNFKPKCKIKKIAVRRT